MGPLSSKNPPFCALYYDTYAGEISVRSRSLKSLQHGAQSFYLSYAASVAAPCLIFSVLDECRLGVSLDLPRVLGRGAHLPRLSGERRRRIGSDTLRTLQRIGGHHQVENDCCACISIAPLHVLRCCELILARDFRLDLLPLEGVGSSKISLGGGGEQLLDSRRHLGIELMSGTAAAIETGSEVAMERGSASIAFDTGIPYCTNNNNDLLFSYIFYVLLFRRQDFYRQLLHRQSVLLREGGLVRRRRRGKENDVPGGADLD